MSDATPPLLSVVTVVRDDPEGLARTRESVQSSITALLSSGSEIEWIVVDGSDPAMPECPIDELATRWICQEPQGIFEAMNAGLAAASGTWIYFLNAGDILTDPAALGRLVAGLGRTSADWGYARVRFLDRNGCQLPEPDWDYKQHRHWLFSRGHFPPHQGTIIKTHCLRDLGGFDTSYRITADYNVVLKLAKTSHPEVWPWTLAEFRQGGASSSRWRIALAEMHRSRRDIFQPHGFAALLEMWHTGVQLAKGSLTHPPTSMRG